MKQSRFNIGCVVLIAVSLVSLASGSGLSNEPAPQDTSSHEVAGKRFFLGYLSGGPDRVNYALFTHICHAFVVADEDGRIVPRTSVPSRKLTAKAHQANVKVILSLGGWGMDKEFAALTSKEEGG